MEENLDAAAARQEGAFPKTRWSLILEAQENDPAALASFCRTYWFPFYTYARRTGLSVSDAEDLTQSFFERMLSRNSLGQAQRERGKLRNFLLRSFNNFAAEEWRKRGTQKRGGASEVLAIDAISAEERLALEPKTSVTPEVEYERAWARELLRQAVERLESDYRSSGEGLIFHSLRDQLADGTSERSYPEIASAIGATEATVRFAAFKLRRRYRDTLREIVAETVESQAEVEEELAHLRTLF